MIKKILGATLLSAIAISGVGAMEMTAGDTMMKKDDAAMMMKKADDSAMMMKKDDAMMMKRKADITTFQESLIEGGYLVLPAGVAKGTLGPKTRAAIIKFQRANGLAETGAFGPKTRAKLSDKAAMMMKKEEGSMMKKDDAMMMKASSSEAMMKKGN